MLKNIKNKLAKENAMITKADNGKTIVIIHANDYNPKVHDFLKNNNFQTPRKDPTDNFQKLIKTALKQCDQIINKNRSNT